MLPGIAVYTERALREDSPIRHGADQGWGILTASFATNRIFAELGFGQIEHSDSMGEHCANMQLGHSGLWNTHRRPKKSRLLEHSLNLCPDSNGRKMSSFGRMRECKPPGQSGATPRHAMNCSGYCQALCKNLSTSRHSGTNPRENLLDTRRCPRPDSPCYLRSRDFYMRAYPNTARAADGDLW
jgi:hypothetical protein